MTDQSLKEKTASGLFWGGISNGVQQILNLVIGIVLGRILNPDDYGLVGMLAIFLTLATTILDSGFTNALVNRKSFQHDDYNAVFWFNIFVGGALFTLLFFLAPSIARFYDNPKLVSLSRVIFLNILLGSLGAAQYGYLFKNVMAKEQAKINIISASVSGVTGIVLALLGFSYWGLAVQSVTNTGLSALLRWYYSPWRPTFSFHLKPLKEMFNFGSKLFITNIFYQINNNLFPVLLGKFYKEEQVGYYSRGQNWMFMGQTFIGGMINGVAQPILAEVVHEKERQRNVLRKMIRFGAFLSFPLMLGFAFVGKEFIVITIGEKWLPAVPFLQLFCLWGALAYLWTLFSNLLIAQGKSASYMWCMIGTGLAQLMAVALLFNYGIMPMLGAYLIVYVLGLLLQNYFIYKLIRLSPLEVLKDIFPYLLITFVSIGISWLITIKIMNIYFLIISKILITAAIYMLFLWKLDSKIFNESYQFIKNKGVFNLNKHKKDR